MLRNKKYSLCLIAIVLSIFYFSGIGFSQEIKALPPFTNTDRVLILSPHPDDEAVGTAGLIQRALQAGAKVKVLCYTNGDNNELAFIVYEKRLTFRKGEFLHMGEVRRKETLAAMALLGLKPADVIFLGYPDFGTMEILTKYWGETRPFKSMLTRVTKVAYPEAMSFNAPYVGESILKDIKQILLDFRPTKVFVSHPADTNRDHRSLYLFLQVALWDLEKQIKRPQIFPCLIHVRGWLKPRGYHPDLELNPPPKLIGASWQKLELTEKEIKTKRDAIACYRSQIKYNPPYLFTFARKNELFGDLSVIKLNKPKTKEIIWQDLGAPEDVEEGLQGENQNQQKLILALAYAIKDDNLLIRITLRRKIDKNLGISIFLLGYNKNLNFARMPKFRFYINALGLHTREKKQAVRIKGIKRKFEGKALIIKIPLISLGEPDYILSYTRARAVGLLLNETAWRIIELE